MINLIIKNKEDIFNEVANIYVNKVEENDSITLGLATGSTPIPLYDKLVEKYEGGMISFKNVKTFNLDEYCNLDINDKNSYHSFMNKNLFSKIDINTNNTHFPTANSEHVDEYNELLEKTPIDVQLLGLGSNGHIAFNEPGSDFKSVTRIVDLAQKTIDDNSRFFSSIDLVPTQAASMGLSNIMDAKEIILIAIGDAKANIIKEIFANDEVTEDIPATILKNHPNVTFYVDLDAAKLLDEK